MDDMINDFQEVADMLNGFKFDMFVEDLNKLIEEVRKVDALKLEVATYRTALAFYADKHNYKQGADNYTLIEKEQGIYAEHILKKGFLGGDDK